MDNLEWTRAGISNGHFQSWGIRQDKRTQLIAVEDIGALAAIMFSNRLDYLGKTLEIAGDELTESEQTETLSRVIGRRVALVQPENSEGNPPDEEQMAGIRFFNGDAYTADIAAVRKIHPSLRTLEEYLRETGWENLSVLPMPERGNAWGN